MRRTIFSLVIAMLIFTVGCGYSKPKAKEPDKETKKETNKEVTGRKETVNLEAAGSVGYDGKAVRRQVDKVLDKYEEKGKELENMLGE